MDKITIFLKYTGSLNFSSRAEFMKNLTSRPGMLECLSYISNIGNPFATVEGLADRSTVWWQTGDEFFIKIFWYTIDSEKTILEFTPEKQALFNSDDWELTIDIENNKHPGVHSSCFFSKFEIFNSVSADYSGRKTLDLPEGRYDLYNQTITQWRHDGHICSMTDSKLARNWDENHYLHAYGPLRFTQVELSMLLDTADYAPYNQGYYYEMSRPNNEIGSSFQEDLNHNNIVLNDEYVKEFIDQIYFTFPYIEKIRKGSYISWPASPISLDVRFRDSKGYYFVLFAENWTCTSTEWTNNQVNYLRDFLDRTPKYTGDLDAILAYAREKWIIQ